MGCSLKYASPAKRILVKHGEAGLMKHLARPSPGKNRQAVKEQVKTLHKEAVTQIHSGGHAAVNKAGFSKGQSETHGFIGV